MIQLTRARNPVPGPVLLGALPAGLVGVTNAQAQITTRRSDPHVFLSNEVKVDLGMNVNDVQSNVQNATFTPHSPKNASDIVNQAGNGNQQSQASGTSGQPATVDAATGF